MRRCARALILNEQNQLLVFERIRQNLFGRVHHYFSIPGGGIEGDETPEAAVVRELREEMMIEIMPKRLLIHQVDEPDQREHDYFLASIVSGTPTFDVRSEEARNVRPFSKNTYRIAWASLDDPLLEYHPAYGQAAAYLRECVHLGRFPDHTVDMRVKNR